MDAVVEDWLFLLDRTPTSWEEVGKTPVLLLVPLPWSTEVGQGTKAQSNRSEGEDSPFPERLEHRAGQPGRVQSLEVNIEESESIARPSRQGLEGGGLSCMSSLFQDWSRNGDTWGQSRTSSRKELCKARLGEWSLTYKMAYSVLLQYSLPNWGQGGTPNFLKYTALFPFGPSLTLQLPGPSAGAAVTAESILMA